VKFSFGQNDFEPSILILAPNKTNFENTFKKEINSFNKSITKNNRKTQEPYLLSEEFLSSPENIKKMLKSEIEFSEKMDFFKMASFSSEQFLAYKFFEKFPNLLILLKDETIGGTLSDFKDISNKSKVQYVLNFSKIDIYKKDKISYANISIQLYDNKTNTVIIEKSYIGDWTNPGFEFACENQSIQCTLNNALSKALNEIIYTIASDSPTLKKEKQLALERYKVLSKDYLTGEFNQNLLDSIIPNEVADSNNVYQVLYNKDTTKFVAFYLEKVSSQNLKSLSEDKKDTNVKIISPNDMKDKKLLEEIPRTYAYIIKAVKYKNKWYFEKSNVTYFQANSIKEGQEMYFNNLQDWNFFKENSTEFNPEFWETNLFEKVPDLRKDPDWEKYGKSSWKSREANNRKFIGLYEIVADKMREHFKEFENKFQKATLIPEVERILKSNNKFIDYYIPKKGTTLVFPEDMSIVLSPVLIKFDDRLERIIYLVFYEGKTFQWTYPQLKEFKGARSFYNSFLINELEPLVDWNFSYDTLDDQSFWDNYVLKKENGTFKYLLRI